MAELHQLPSASGTRASGREPVPFRSMLEGGFVIDADAPTALIFNPQAPASSLAAAAAYRATLLHGALNAWSCVPRSGEVCASEAAEHLSPLADELRIVLAELTRRIEAAEAVARADTATRELPHG